MSANVKTSLKNELAIIRVNSDKTFEDKYLKLDGKLTSIYKFKKLGKNFKDSDTDSDLDWSGAQPRKLMEAAVGEIAGKVGTSYFDDKSSDAELDTLKDDNKEEGYVKKIVDGRKVSWKINIIFTTCIIIINYTTKNYKSSRVGDMGLILPQNHNQDF